MLAEEIPRKHILYPPGGIMVWLIVSVELLTFIPGLIYFSASRYANPELYQESAAQLDTNAGLINTIILLTSGWLMALCIGALRKGKEKLARHLLLTTILTGSLFIIVKTLEYTSKLSAGFNIHYNEFYTYYWLLTGFHYLHVLTGLIILIYMWIRLKQGIYNSQNYYDIETSGIFWHMCDLIWVLLFPVFYLIK